MSQSIGADHLKALGNYLSGLQEAGKGLPSHGGKVNASAVATACGFNREVLYQNQQCQMLLNSAAESLGLRGVEARETVADADKVKLERRLTHLEQQNSALVAEVYELRRKLASYGHIEEMLEAGKRVIP